MREYKFLVKLKSGNKKIVSAVSKTMNGAVRKLFQEYEIDQFLEILCHNNCLNWFRKTIGLLTPYYNSLI